jgi:hypothetical protein
MQAIIYLQDNGVIAVVHPSPEAVQVYGIEAIALKDVPEGKPFKIIDASQVPQDREARMAWKVSEDELTDGVGADYSTFPVEQ